MRKQREHWGSRIGFIMAAAGSSIGLGTLWMFPYLTGENGGGLFVLIYLIAMLFVGFPIFIAELILGRSTERSAVGAFAEHTHSESQWKIVGWMGAMASFLIMSYYGVIAGWGIHYVGLSLSEFYAGRTADEIVSVFGILERSGDINILWHGLFSIMTVSVVYMGVRNGIERWSFLMTSSLLVMLLLLFVYALNLDGFSDALHFIFYPDIAKLKPSGVLEALGLSFFTLSLGQGVMITYGSYMRKDEDVPRMGMIIVLMDVLVSLLAAMVIFPIIFTFGFEPKSGPGLVFKILPVAFSQLPAARLISSSFFLLFVFTALTSSVALIEVVVANFIDLYGWTRKRTCLIVGTAVFIVGIPTALGQSGGVFENWAAIYGMSYFEVMSTIVSNWLLPIGGLMTAIFTGWRLRREVIEREFKRGTEWAWLFRPWLLMVRWVAPTATLLIILYKTGLIDVDLLF
ncbi:Uncharacterized sodium-dependent transporter YhdH [Chlamydiales bacterium SCGC AG-110-M15]|nr:Uncharacterized sodium-dependent transporter YhdH [Chlamydiales bacterium SCGC AG-110-M15]